MTAWMLLLLLVDRLPCWQSCRGDWQRGGAVLQLSCCWPLLCCLLPGRCWWLRLTAAAPLPPPHRVSCWWLREPLLLLLLLDHLLCLIPAGSGPGAGSSRQHGGRGR